MVDTTAARSRVPLFAFMARLPGRPALVPPVPGVPADTDAPGIGSVTTALPSAGGALTPVALPIVAAGARSTARTREA